MQSFWDAHRWPTQEHRAHWHVLFDHQPAVRDFARAHADLLSRHPELTPVPIEGLHATLQSIGPLSASQAAEVAAAARPVLQTVGPFEVEVGPAQIVHNGVVAAVYPEDDMSRLYWALRETTESVVGSDAMPPAPDRFWPHLTLAYSQTEWNADDLARALVKLRPPRATMTVASVALVDQQQRWRDRYVWDEVATVTLADAIEHENGPAA
ncbi:2'-5' RNA ligase family protein [Streptomyces sp. 4N509B]|uniref:2'-5' RNA ligase family protein n=1 Tax=Streptomyces sp. 4N509B TaxID=3457413 RepID=UPI003FD0C916